MSLEIPAKHTIFRILELADKDPFDLCVIEEAPQIPEENGMLSNTDDGIVKIFSNLRGFEDAAINTDLAAINGPFRLELYHTSNIEGLVAKITKILYQYKKYYPIGWNMANDGVYDNIKILSSEIPDETEKNAKKKNFEGGSPQRMGIINGELQLIRYINQGD